MTAYTVTFTPGVANEISLAVVVLTGANTTSPAGRTGTSTSLPPNFSITPEFTGSLIFGGWSISETVNQWPYTAFSAATTILQEAADSNGGKHNVALESAATTTAGTPVTMGVTATGNELAAAQVLCEIAPNGTLAVDASTPAVVPASGSAALSSLASISTASFTPPPGSLLVAIIINQNGGTVTAAQVSSTPALTWTIAVQVRSGAVATGIATAAIPGAPAADGAFPLPVLRSLGRV